MQLIKVQIGKSGPVRSQIFRSRSGVKNMDKSNADKSRYKWGPVCSQIFRSRTRDGARMPHCKHPAVRWPHTQHSTYLPWPFDVEKHLLQN